MSGWLAGMRIAAWGRRGGPAARGAAVLGRLGASVHFGPGPERLGPVIVDGWAGELQAAAGAGLLDRPRGRPCAQYLGLLAAWRLLAGGDTVRATDAAALRIGQSPRPRADLLRCRDGWLVARWRSAEERQLLPDDLRSMSIGELTDEVRGLRLLAAPVLPGAGAGWRTPDAGCERGQPAGRRLRVVDWSSLIAGPSACAMLAEAGADVVRIEHPGRPDGLRRGDPELWARLNGTKRLLLADAATEAGWRDVAEALRWADLVVSGHSLRVLPQLGFTPAWFRRWAPAAAVVELVAYLPPHEGQPGLGEQAAAVAGLLWDGDRRPRPPRPWADPLAGVLCAVIAGAWDASGRRAGARVRVSLEGAAGLAR